jgi:putative Holliday junction resolvase
MPGTQPVNRATGHHNLRTVLGFDFGQKRIGIAVGQEITRTATALETVNSRNTQPDWDSISALVKTWQPDLLVVGLALHADGSDSAMTKPTRDFAAKLKTRYRLPVEFMNERLSSRAAEGLAGDGQNADKGIDALAAMVILQDWLEQQTHEDK